MEAMRQSWTDERLDDLNRNVDRRFDQVDQRFDQVDQRFEQLERQIGGFRSDMDLRFDSLQRTMFQASVALIVALLGVLATQL
jgi:hypothetical protein